MKFATLFVAVMAAGTLAAVIAGCGATGPAPVSLEQPPPPTSTPAATRLYVDHNGTFYEYALPLRSDSKPLLTLTEWPGLTIAPVIAADQYGNVAVASPKEIRIFHRPIVSFAGSQAKLSIKLTPAITEVGPFGADLADLEYDPNENLWLFNNLGGAGGGAEISELRTPLSKKSVAAVTIDFGAPGSKTAGFTTLVQGRFDVNAALYVYASSSARQLLFKVSFPYAKPPGSVGINLAEADILDTSQWPPTAPAAPSLLLGQYTGALRSPRPGSPPSPPVDVTAQFAQPFNVQQGLFPEEHIDTIVGALIADPYRYSFYTLDAGDGSLDVYRLPMASKATPKLSLKCLAGPSNCSDKLEHLFLAP
jgi:hypothetical protein